MTTQVHVYKPHQLVHTLANIRTKYLFMCDVYTDVGGITRRLSNTQMDKPFIISISYFSDFSLVYIRWGRTVCPGDADLIYHGKYCRIMFYPFNDCTTVVAVPSYLFICSSIRCVLGGVRDWTHR